MVSSVVRVMERCGQPAILRFGIAWALATIQPMPLEWTERRGRAADYC